MFVALGWVGGMMKILVYKVASFPASETEIEDPVQVGRESLVPVLRKMFSRLFRDAGITGFLSLPDWVILHDQFVPGRHSYAIFRDEKTGNGTDAARTGAISFN